MSQDVTATSVSGRDAASPVEVYTFGPYRVDVARHAVTRDGDAVALTPKAFELLLILLRSGGRVLSRHQLIAALWPDTFVEEANLSFQVSTLRKALGPAAEHWIETVPKVGYRFTPAVDSHGWVEVGPLNSQPHSSASIANEYGDCDAPLRFASRVPRWARWVAPAVVLSATLGVVSYGVARFRMAPPAAASRIGLHASPLTSYVGAEVSPSLSPDGSHVAFDWVGPNRDNVDVYIKLVRGGEPIRLTSKPEFEGMPAWSPEGERIAYTRGRPDGLLDLMVIPALGGTERRVAAALRLHSGTVDQLGVPLLSWTPDGKWIAIGAEVDGAVGIWAFAADGSERRRITSSRFRDWAPAFSADGRRMAFVRWLSMGRQPLLVVSLDAHLKPIADAVTVVDPYPRHVMSVVWEPRGSALVYSVGAHMGSSRLWRVSMPPGAHVGAPSPLPVGDQATGLDMAASGRLVYVARFRDSGLWRLDLRNPASGLADTGVPASVFDEHTPHYSPDGRRLAFASTRSGTEEIWISNADGSDPRQMTWLGGTIAANPRWSPDGRIIVFDSGVGASKDLFLLDPATAEARRLTSGPGEEGQSRWSRDGQSIYFSAAAVGRELSPELWRIPAAGGPAVQVTSGGAMAAEETHDGRLLYFTRQVWPRMTLWRMPTPGGEAVQVADDLVDSLAFAVGRTKVYMVVRQQQPPRVAIDAMDIRSGVRTRLATVDRSWWWGLALSPDERTLLIPLVNSRGTDLMLVEPAD